MPTIAITVIQLLYVLLATTTVVVAVAALPNLRRGVSDAREPGQAALGVEALGGGEHCDFELAKPPFANFRQFVNSILNLLIQCRIY